MEELEALRLKDLEGLEQMRCAEQMGIARTTFQRILYSARSKIAKALVKGNALRIEGGEYVISERLYKCACGSRFTAPRYGGQEERELCCPGCGKRLGYGAGRRPVKGGCSQQGDRTSADDQEESDDSEHEDQ